jgi:hypothetical protein
MGKDEFGWLLLKIIPSLIIVTFAIVALQLDKKSNPVIGIIVYNIIILTICLIVWAVISIFYPLAYWQVAAAAYGIVILAAILNAIRLKRGNN